MKRDKVHSKVTSRISRKDNLPLLRGMFVAPQAAVKVRRPDHRDSYDYGNAEDGLFLTAKEGFYLGG
jgi:hypothetical protein